MYETASIKWNKKDLIRKINRIRKTKNAVILAHYYQMPEIQDIADYIGDSLGLSQNAAKTNADIIIFAGVHFMAETAKILNPKKKVIIPDQDASCSLAESCTTEKFRSFIARYPKHIVVSYINCSAEIKAMSDIICTSSNAIQIVNSIPRSEKILFAPDKNLGKFVQQVTGRKMVIWDGTCIVHHEFSAGQIKILKNQYPGIQLIAHPECSSYVLDIADYIGSTTGLIKHAQKSNCSAFIVATEANLFHQLKQINPAKIFIKAPVINTCTACQQCPYMKLNTLGKLYKCLVYEEPEIIIKEHIQMNAFKSINRMMQLSKSYGTINCD